MNRVSLVLSALVALLLVGCATRIEGTATAPVSISVTPPIPAGLDTGEFTTVPAAIRQGDGDAVWTAEGNRMSEALILPREIDPALAEGVVGQDAVPTLTWLDDTALPSDLRGVFRNQKVGVSIARSMTNGSGREVRLGLHRFADEGYARAAVEEAALTRTATKAPVVALSSDPSAIAAWWTAGAVDAVTSFGPLVIHVAARGGDAAGIVDLVERALSRQRTATERFTPTPVADVPSAPLDEGGVLARTLSEENPDAKYLRYIGALSLPMFERRIVDPSVNAQFKEAGVDIVGWNIGKVARARDDTAARRLLMERYATDSIEGIDELGDAVKCRRTPETFSCGTAVGRYFATVADPDEKTVRQMAAAQWVILMRAR